MTRDRVLGFKMVNMVNMVKMVLPVVLGTGRVVRLGSSCDAGEPSRLRRWFSNR
jgi:hypothetical protein